MAAIFDSERTCPYGDPDGITLKLAARVVGRSVTAVRGLDYRYKLAANRPKSTHPVLLDELQSCCNPPAIKTAIAPLHRGIGLAGIALISRLSQLINDALFAS